MPRVTFTPNLRRHIDCPELTLPGDTVRAVLQELQRENPRLAHYVLDEQGNVRKHIMLFHNGQPLQDRREQSDPIEPHDELCIMQALSGG
ncbi:MAG: MoaD/ThiS family protein [Pirellulales bacterium]|nr:MoaD/ThiS family protein [Pirellulales bacterium]